MIEKESDLPETWAWTPLADLGSWVGGGTPAKNHAAFWNGGVPWVSPKDMKSFHIHDTEDHITEDAVLASATSKLPAGAVLMVTRSGILRHTFPVAVARLPVALNQDLKAVVLRDGLHPDFVAYALRLYGRDILHSCMKDGTTVQSIEFPALKRFKIPIAPCREQHRIADALDELFSDLDAGVAALQRVREKLKLYRASVLKAAVEGDLTAEWRAHHPNTEPASELLKRIFAKRRRRWEEEQLANFKKNGQESPPNWKTKYREPLVRTTSDVSRLPEGWSWTSFDQIGDTQGGLQKSPARTPRSNHYPYLRVANVNRGSLDLSVLHRFELTDMELERLRLQVGDILIVEGNGSRTEIGRCALWDGQVADCVHQNHIIRVRPFPEVLPKYVNIFLNSPIGQTFIQMVASSTSGLYTLSISKIDRLPIALPPTVEQEVIVEMVEDYLSVIEHLETDIEMKFKGAQSLRQAILRHAFTGKLVSQDPRDEPASELLKRIAAEREARGGEAGAKRPNNSGRGRVKKNTQ